MAVNVSFNGTNYSIPTSAERGWAALTNYLRDLGLYAQTVTGQKANVRTALTTPDTVLVNDYTVLVDLTTPGASIVNLPAGIDKTIYVIADGKGDAQTNLITVQSSSGQLINGSATLNIANNYGAVMVQFDSTSNEWHILSQYIGMSPTFTGLTLSGLSTGIVHSSVSGVLSSSLLVNADVSPSAAIQYSKLSLTGAILNADISGAAAIAYSKLNLASSITFADLSGSFALPRASVAAGTADHVVINSALGVLSSEAQLAKVRGGAGSDQTNVTYPTTGTLVTREATETLQNKSLNAPVVSDYEDFIENSTPSTPASGRIRVYAKADKNMYQLDSLGVETQLAVSGGGGGSFDVNTIVTDGGDVVVDLVSGNVVTSV